MCEKHRKSWLNCFSTQSPRNRSNDQILVEVRAKRSFKVTAQINSKQPEHFYFSDFSLILRDYNFLDLMVKDALFILFKLRYDLYTVKWTGRKYSLLSFDKCVHPCDSYLSRFL